MKRPLSALVDRSPGFAVLSGALTGCLGYFIDGTFGTAAWLLPIPAMFLFLRLAGLSRTVRFFFPALLLVLFSGTVRDAMLRSGINRSVREKQTGNFLKVRFCDDASARLQNRKTIVLAEVLSRGFSANAAVPDSGRVFVRLPRESEEPLYGDIFLLEGHFEPVGGPVNGYLNYAEIRSVRNVFSAFRAQKLENGRGFFRTLFDIRQKFLDGLLAPMSDPYAKAMTPAVFFGLTHGLDRDTKNDFLTAGHLHILSVSGFHLGLFFTVVFLLFRWMPEKPRFLTVLLPVFLYALSTGMNSPAMRAFLMLSVFCVLKAYHCRTESVNTLMLIAAVLLIWNPRQSLSPGFQFSFLCVYFLLEGSVFMKGCSNAANPFQRFRSGGKRRRSLLSVLILTAGASVSACAASSAVSICRQGLFSVSALPAYLLSVPALWGAFALLVFDAFFWWVPGIPAFCGVILEQLFRAVKGIAEYFGGSGLWTTPAPWPAAVGFLALLLWTLKAESRKGRIFASCAAALTLSGMAMIPLFTRPSLAVVYGGGSTPAFLLLNPPSGGALAVNTPDFETARVLTEQLRKNGIQRIDELTFERCGRAYCGGAGTLLRNLEIAELTFPGKIPKTAKYARMLLSEWEKTGVVSRGASLLKPLPDGFRTDWGNLGDFEIRHRENPDGTHFLRVTESGRTVFERNLVRSSVREVLEIPLSRRF